MTKLPGVVPADPVAAQAFVALEADATIPDDVRDTCQVALQSVGRAVWDNHHRNLALAREGVADFDNAVNCYTSVVKWAVVSGALSATRANRFCAELEAAGGTAGGVNDKAMFIIHSLMPVRGWAPGDAVPRGAMVYHGRPGNPISHVTLHVGNNLVVGCWGSAYTEGGAVAAQFQAQMARGWCPDTMITPIDAFGQLGVGYSLNPFWRDLKI